MAQLRQDYDQFAARDIEIVVVGPEGAQAFASYFAKESLPFIGLPDPTASVIDKAGVARYVHYGHSMSDIPENEELLALGDEINAAQGAKNVRAL